MSNRIKSDRQMQGARAGALALLVALLLVGALLALAGCANTWSKGEGSLFRIALEVGNAPMTGQGAMTHKGKPTGPAELVASRPLPEPSYSTQKAAPLK